MQISYESEVTGFCQELVRLPSLSGEEEAVAQCVQHEMEMLGYDRVERDVFGSVVGLVRGAGPGPTIVIDAHMDVVPVTSPGSWRFNAFSGEVAEGRLWGRGAVDVKGSLAAAVVALGSLPRSRVAGTLVLAATVGEEMIEGVALEAVLRRYEADCVVVCEPTGLRLGLGHKGRTGLVLTAEGVAAHSARPEDGVNAVYGILEAISRLRRVPRRQDSSLGAGVMEVVEIISSPYPGTSMVPHLCTARFDRRLVRGETAETVMAEVREALRGLRGLTVAYHRPTLHCYTGHAATVDDFHAAWAMSPEHPMVQRALSGLHRAGQTPQTFYAPYCTNGASSAGVLGLPTLIYGAGEIECAHVVNEALPLDDLGAAFRGYRALALSLAGGAADV